MTRWGSSHSLAAEASSSRKTGNGLMEASRTALKTVGSLGFGRRAPSPDARLDRHLLIERLKLERQISTMCPRFVIGMLISFLLSLTLMNANISARGQINQLLADSFALHDIEQSAIRTPEDVRHFMQQFAETTADFSPVSSKHVPNPDFVTIVGELKQYQAERTLPSELRPTIRTAFTSPPPMRAAGPS